MALKDSGIRFIYFPRTLDGMMKRTFDAVVSFLGLVLLSPFLLPVAILIKLDSPGPILFRRSAAFLAIHGHLKSAQPARN